MEGQFEVPVFMFGVVGWGAPSFVISLLSPELDWAPHREGTVLSNATQVLHVLL